MTDYPESFKDYPKSLAEIKSDSDHNAALWTPRDALISTLRDLDNGAITVDALVIVHTAFLAEGATKTGYVSSGQNIVMTLGLLTYAQHRIMSDDNFR